MQQVLFEAGPIQQQEQLPDDPDPLDRLGKVESTKAADNLAQGGIFVTDSGQVLEKTPPSEATKDGTSGITILPHTIDQGNNLKKSDRKKHLQLEGLSLGVETEFGTYDSRTGEPHPYSRDGKIVNYPDGTSKTADEVNHDAEATIFTTERKKLLISPDPDKDSDVYQVTKLDPSNYVTKFIRFMRGDKKGLAESGISTPGLSMHPYLLTAGEITDQKYMKKFHKEGMFVDFAGVLGVHINVEGEAEDGLAAATFNQAFVPLFSALSAASPFRDGRTDTTLRQHYVENPYYSEEQIRQISVDNGLSEIETESVIANYKKMSDIVSIYDDEQLARMNIDWRQISRIHASPSGGVITDPTHITLEENLAAAHEKLQEGEIPTIDRLYGQHTSRFCHKKGNGVVEFCDLSRAGDNPHKLAALVTTVYETIKALQIYHSDQDAQAKYDEAWSGIIPSPDQLDDPAARKKYVDVATANLVITSLYGKHRQMYDVNSVTESGALDNTVSGRSLDEYLEVLFNFIDSVNTENTISENHKEELFATLQFVPEREFATADDAITRFFEPNSPMTAADCLRVAAQLEPELSINELILRFDKRCMEELEKYDQPEIIKQKRFASFKGNLARVAIGVLMPIGIR